MVPLAFVLLTASPLSARQAGTPPSATLAEPDAVLAEPFSLIRGAVELSGGRLLISDWIEQRLALVDFGTGAVAGPYPEQNRARADGRHRSPTARARGACTRLP